MANIDENKPLKYSSAWVSKLREGTTPEDYLKERIDILEKVVKCLMEVIALTATPWQLDVLGRIGRETNQELDKLEGK
jgi:hypothetical protein